MGYSRAGFDVVGVDIAPQPNYPFEFVQADAIQLVKGLIVDKWWSGHRAYLGDDRQVRALAAIHASPPCQAYSITTRDKTRHQDLIPAIRELLKATGLPYVIENVPGAPLHEPVMICGSSLGLKVRRHRLFETNWPLMVPPCAHGQQGQPVGVYGEGSGTGQRRGRKAANLAERQQVMEIPWADMQGVTQAIPPLYTELIGYQLLAHLKAAVA